MEKSVATHSGVFHCDEVMAICILKLIFPDMTIIRSRNADEFQSCDIVVDVGCVYDPDTDRYDHHFQNAPTYEDGLPYSSCGLVWRHYGMRICKSERVYDIITNNLIRPIDAADNAVKTMQRIMNSPNVGQITIGQIVKSFMPNGSSDQSEFDRQFFVVIEFMITILKNYLSCAEFQANGEQHVYQCCQDAIQKEQLYVYLNIEPSLFSGIINQFSDSIYYIIFKDELSGQYRVKATTRNFSSVSTLPFPPEWRGLQEDQLRKITGDPDILFCHHSGFMIGTKTLESAVSLVEKSVTQQRGGF